jgi:hypothetical protein
MPIIATVKAVKAAMGLMASRIDLAAKTVAKAMRETNTSSVPIVKLLWLISQLTPFLSIIRAVLI